MKERLDKVLTDRGLAPSRSQAKSLIEKGDVSVAGSMIKKAGELIDPTSEITVHSPLYVGRGAFKLEAALSEFSLSVRDLVCLDVGASTGGFTEVLLLHGARKVYAVDVGSDQLAPKLKEDRRVINLEGTNIKDLSELPEPVHAAVMDLSFISITKVLGPLRRLMKPGAFLVALIKPQFEAGPERLPKDGVIKDGIVRDEILAEVLASAKDQGWTLQKLIRSPIEGKSGNVEFLAYLNLI